MCCCWTDSNKEDEGIDAVEEEQWRNLKPTYNTVYSNNIHTFKIMSKEYYVIVRLTSPLVFQKVIYCLLPVVVLTDTLFSFNRLRVSMTVGPFQSFTLQIFHTLHTYHASCNMQTLSSTSTNPPSLPGPIQLNQDEDNTSAEAGGIVRGAARTATTMSRRAVIGRLPKAAPKPPRIIIPKGKAPMPRIMPKKVPLKHVARVSDRISTGFDAYDAVTSSSSGGTAADEANAMKVRWRHLSQRILSFSGSEFLFLSCNM